MEELLKKYHLKCTKQRIKVLEIIKLLGDQASIKNITNKLPDIDPSTVYRTIILLSDNRIIESYVNYDQEKVYNLKEEHSHYFTCIKCHHQEKLNECPVDHLVDDLLNNDYEIINHSIHIEGICNKCQKKPSISK